MCHIIESASLYLSVILCSMFTRTILQRSVFNFVYKKWGMFNSDWALWELSSETREITRFFILHMHLQTIDLQDEATSGWQQTNAWQRVRPLICETAATFSKTENMLRDEKRNFTCTLVTHWSSDSHVWWRAGPSCLAHPHISPALPGNNCVTQRSEGQARTVIQPSRHTQPGTSQGMSHTLNNHKTRRSQKNCERNKKLRGKKIMRHLTHSLCQS